VSQTLAGALAGMVNGATAWMKPYRRAMTRTLVANRLTQRVAVATPGGVLYIEAASGRSLHYPDRLYEDEPETIRWLDALPPADNLWDIGANIGIFALYAARARGMRVLAFEPGAASHAALVRNIEINSLGDRIDAFCLAFDTAERLDYLQMANTEAGHPLHVFGAERAARPGVRPHFRQSVPAFAIDRFCALFRPPPPHHIKLDVDGIELDILKGGAATIAAHARSLLVEIEADAAGRAIRAFLAGLDFSEDAAFAAQGARRNVLFRRVAQNGGDR